MLVLQPAKQWDVYMTWSNRITEEFWHQGDAERATGLEVTPIFDRENPLPQEKLQVGWCVRAREHFVLFGVHARVSTSSCSMHSSGCGVVLVQAGFIKGIVKPLYTAFAQVPGVNLGVCTAQLAKNLERWTSMIKTGVVQPAAPTTTAPTSDSGTGASAGES